MSSLVFLVTFIPLLACFIPIKEYEVFFFTVDINNVNSERCLESLTAITSG